MSLWSSARWLTFLKIVFSCPQRHKLHGPTNQGFELGNSDFRPTLPGYNECCACSSVPFNVTPFPNARYSLLVGTTGCHWGKHATNHLLTYLLTKHRPPKRTTTQEQRQTRVKQRVSTRQFTNVAYGGAARDPLQTPGDSTSNPCEGWVL